MVVVVRLEVSDADKKAFKEIMGQLPSRKNIKACVQKNFDRMIYPDGRPAVKAKKFKLTR